jgi:putative transposase
MCFSIRRCAQDAKRHGDLYFAALLPEHLIQQAFAKASAKLTGWIYSPAVTVWCFLSQVLSPDHSCRDTVARLNAFRVAQGKRPCSPDTGGYCIARDKLPEAVCQNLFEHSGEEISQAAPPSWLWHGRRVMVADGTTITMPDTPENQIEYPQPESQRRGCGFPIMRIVVLFCLATGVALKMALSRYTGKQTGEASLCRSLADTLERGGILLADRIFCGWFDVALHEQSGVDVVLRKHASRKTDFRTGTRLGKDDHLVPWYKPPQKPEWMVQEAYDSLPEYIIVRELRVRISTPGFRTRELIVITTLHNDDLFTKEEIAELYRRRWQAELNLRSLKTVLQMDHLRCKQPHRVRNELRLHLLGYNLMRGVMVEAAKSSGVEPWQISFKGTLQAVNEFLRMLMCTNDVNAWCDSLLFCVAYHTVGDRPNRCEPRARKKRPKPFPPLTRPRWQKKNRRAA